MPGWLMGRSRVGAASVPYELTFHPEALQEWRILTTGIPEQFKTELAERLIAPQIPASKLRGSSHRTKIKLRSARFRLAYEMHDREVLMLVVAVGERERKAAYRQAVQDQKETQQ